MKQEQIGDYRVSMLNRDLRLVNGTALLTRDEAAEVYRFPDTIQRLDPCEGNPTWIKIDPREIGR